MSRLGRLGLIAAAAAVAVAAMFADHAAPGSRTVRSVQVFGSQEIPRPEGTSPDRPRAWRMRLSLDPDMRQPGPEWVMREGRSAGRGYELAWVPEAFALHLQRGGPVPMLLGIARLQRPPREVVFARRGARIAAIVDNVPLIDALDPQGVPEPGGVWPDGWSVTTDGNMGSANLTVQDDGDLPAAWASDVAPGDDRALGEATALGPAELGERDRAGTPRRVLAVRGWAPPEAAGRGDHALLCVRQALALGPERDDALAQEVIGEAGRAVAALGSGHPSHDALVLWLAWAEARDALASAGQDEAARVRPALEQLAVLAAGRRRSEGAGMLIALLPDLAERAVRRPAVPRPLTEVLAERAAWFATLDQVARAALDVLGPGAGDDLTMQLRFISHAAGALGGADGGGGPTILPTPANAPFWLAVRWRALAGTDPDPGGGSSLPPATARQTTRALVLPVVERLVRAASLEPLSAVRLRAALADLPPGPQARPIETAPARETALATLIVALRRFQDSRPGPERDDAAGRVAQASRVLGQLRGDAGVRSDSLVASDPLAYALACLAAQRIQRPAGQAAGTELSRAVFTPPELKGPFAQLSPYARLLSGSASATDMVWLHDDAVLPPSQALAAALAMQEVAYRIATDNATRSADQAEPDWSGLRRLPCFTLPLELLDPVVRKPVPGEGPATTAPPPIP